MDSNELQAIEEQAALAAANTRALAAEVRRCWEVITDSDPQPAPGLFATPIPQGIARVVSVAPGKLPAALDAAQPGDDLVLTPGTHSYNVGNLSARRSGTPGAWIRVRGAAGPRPVIDLQNSGEWAISSSYFVLENLDVTRGGGNNLHLTPSSAPLVNVIIRDCTSRSVASGPGACIKLNRNNNLGLSRIYIERCDLSRPRNNAIVDGVGCELVVVRDCDIHHNSSDEPQAGLFFKGGSTSILIERNYIHAIRKNAALQLGGDTGRPYWNLAVPAWEGLNQIARDNLIADCDDSVFEVRGVSGGRVHRNTVLTQTSFAVFRFQRGEEGKIENADFEADGNLIVATASPQAAVNSGGAIVGLRFGRQLWCGPLRSGLGLPAQGDVVLPAGAPVLVGPLTPWPASAAEAWTRLAARPEYASFGARRA